MATIVDWYGLGLASLLRGNLDLDGDTLRASLHTTTYAPNLDTDGFFDRATNELATASGYTAGGVALAGLAVSYDAATKQARWTFTNPSWTFTAGVTFRYVVLRRARGGAASADELLARVDYGTSQTVSGVWSPTLDPTGMLNLTRP